MNKSKKLYPFKFEANCPSLDENSVIINGFLSENSIDDVLDTYLGEITGNDNFQYYKGVFPIKISFKKIDSKYLAPQLHPDSATALERYMSMGKAKLWYITKSTDTTLLYLGFNKQMDAATFYNNCLNGTITANLHHFTPKVGDYIYIKPGYVHAVKGELEFIEVSQNSEITYHLTGEDASMEVAEAIDVVEYTPVDEKAWRISGIEGDTTIANTSGFIVKYLNLKKAVEKSTQESFIIYVSLQGSARIDVNGSTYEFGKDEMILVPAGMDEFILSNNGENCRILEIYLPKVTDIEKDLYLNYYEDDECDHECDCGCDHDHDHDHHHHGNHSGELFFKH